MNDDARLIERIFESDQTFEAVLETVKTFRWLRLSEDEAKDIASVVFMRLRKKTKQDFPDDQHLIAYMKTTAEGERQQLREPWRAGEITFVSLPEDVSQPNYASGLEVQVFKECLASAFDALEVVRAELSDRDREVFDRWYDGERKVDIAKAMGLTLKNVSKITLRVVRAIIQRTESQ